MGKIMAQIMKREVSNLVPLIFVRLLLKRTEPMMNARLRQPLAPLRGENVRAGGITSTMLNILEEWTPNLIEQINIA